MKNNLEYQFHHFGIPVKENLEQGTYSEKAGMYAFDNPGIFRVQRHHFTRNFPIHSLLKTVSHVAFKVNDLTQAIDGEEVILRPYESIDDYFVAVINDNAVPIELIQTTLSDEELWGRARSCQGSLYRK